MKLSISVVTMNRANQLQQALESCLRCRLPEDTEFVVIDNASTDDTRERVRSVLKQSGYVWYYERLNENLGVGGGRNYAFSHCRGDYIYVLDDDAVIDCQKNPDFFLRALQQMDGQSRIATLSTQIYDTAWQDYRINVGSQPRMGDLYLCMMFFGGSHFLRRSCFDCPPYLPNRYGYEELPASLEVWDRGLYNVVDADLQIIHRPAVNKWDFQKQENHAQVIREVATVYALKRMLYPAAARPLLRAAYGKRCRMYLVQVPRGREQADRAVKEMMQTYPLKQRVRLSTLLRLIRQFGSRVF